MVGWTRLDTPDLPFANSGLAQDHAYSVLGVERSGGARMVRVRNPWGQNGWAAPRSALGLKALDGGVLLVPLDVFAQRFLGVGAAPTR